MKGSDFVAILVLSWLAVGLPGQLLQRTLPLLPASTTGLVNADAVGIFLTVKNPVGIWLGSSAHGSAWIYVMENHWMRYSGSYLEPSYSLPNLDTTNRWTHDSAGTGLQYLLPGLYWLIMADDWQDPARDPSPVLPGSNILFGNADLDLQCMGFVNQPSWSRPIGLEWLLLHNMQSTPCALVGGFPYAVAGPTPPPALAFVNGAHKDTCAYQPIAPGNREGACHRWIMRNASASSSYLDVLRLRMEWISLDPPRAPQLPPATTGFLVFSFSPNSRNQLVGELGITWAEFFRQGGWWWVNPMVISMATALDPVTLEYSVSLGADPAVRGVDIYVQGMIWDAGGRADVTDVYAVVLR